MDLKIKSHIAESGLEPEDLNVRTLTHAELAACKVSNLQTEGYVIPYYNVEGDPIPFYRLRLFNHPHKYKQPFQTQSHVYFPKDLHKCLAASKFNCIIITEGERKAAAGVKAGIPTVGLGGVDSWRSRTVVLPGDTTLEPAKKGTKKIILAKVPSKTYGLEVLTDTVAEGFNELIDLAIAYELNIIIVYDTDLPIYPFVKTQVQRAANTLAHELVNRGIYTDKLRHMMLPPDKDLGKMGLDDFIIKNGKGAFEALVQETLDKRVAFPRHPSPKNLVSNALNRGKVGRKEMMTLTRNVITEMDCRGVRMIDKNSRVPYYFEFKSKTLMPAKLLSRDQALHETPFGAHLHKEYGVSAADTGFIQRLAPLYGTEEPIDTVSPVRVLTSTDDSIILQLSDSEMAVVTGDKTQPIHIYSNGHNGVLFEQDNVDPIDTAKFMAEFQKQIKEPLKPWWSEVLNTVNLQGEHSNELATLLFYISPWLRRWRGTQLPVEIVCGEAGSGKSSIFTIRLKILTGRPKLRNIPSDIKDWYASVGSTGGLHVIDNVQFTNKALRQQLSDEICRIITEPNPHVEMRTLYTTSSLHSMPVNSVFAFTAIDQPFHNADLLQRSAVFTVEAVKQGNLLGDWATTHIDKRGGREAWLAHHFVVLHKFLALVKEEWVEQQGASHRLAHYQQCMRMVGKILDIDTSWLKETLTKATTELISDSDWTLQGIKEYVSMCLDNHMDQFTAKNLSEWAKLNDDYSSNPLLTTPKRLSRYFISHKNLIRVSTGAEASPTKRNNLIYYIIKKIPEK